MLPLRELAGHTEQIAVDGGAEPGAVRRGVWMDLPAWLESWLGPMLVGAG